MVREGVELERGACKEEWEIHDGEDEVEEGKREVNSKRRGRAGRSGAAVQRGPKRRRRGGRGGHR